MPPAVMARVGTQPRAMRKPEELPRAGMPLPVRQVPSLGQVKQKPPPSMEAMLFPEPLKVEMLFRSSLDVNLSEAVPVTVVMQIQLQ